MHIDEAIRSRRTIFHFKPDPVPTELLVHALEAGIWAPNHHISEPWRFTHIGEKSKEALALRYAELQLCKVPDVLTEEQRKERHQGFYVKFRSKPAIVCVSCIVEGDEVRRREDLAAVCCAVQNVQLAAWAQGIGMQWPPMPRPEKHECGDRPNATRVLGKSWL